MSGDLRLGKDEFQIPVNVRIQGNVEAFDAEGVNAVDRNIRTDTGRERTGEPAASEVSVFKDACLRFFAGAGKQFNKVYRMLGAHDFKPFAISRMRARASYFELILLSRTMIIE